MRDDERYPIVVPPEDGTDAPEVVAGLEADPEGRDKVTAPDSENGLIPKYDNAQKEAVYPHPRGSGAGGVPGTANAPGRSRTCCGLKRRTFLIALAVVVVILIGAIVGGVVGGLKANSSSGDEPPSPTEPVPTGPIEANQRHLSVSSSDADIQVFYNSLNSQELLYRRVHNDAAGPEHTADLTTPPDFGSPLAAVVVADSVQVFYLTTNDSATHIAQATLDCSLADTGGACETTGNEIVTRNITGQVHAATKLAALPGGSFARVWFQTRDGEMWLLDGEEDGWTDSQVASGVYPGSHIAAAGPNTTNANLFFVANSTKKLRYMETSDVLDRTAAAASAPQLDDNWSANSPLAATYIPRLAPLRVYYAGPASGAIVSYVQPNATASWQRVQEKSWGKAQGGIGAAAWARQTRLFYFQRGGLFMSALNGTSWREPKKIS